MLNNCGPENTSLGHKTRPGTNQTWNKSFRFKEKGGSSYRKKKKNVHEQECWIRGASVGEVVWCGGVG
ncbi:hypothetical protein DKP78_15425, partial [Enterococcus faecium]